MEGSRDPLLQNLQLGQKEHHVWNFGTKKYLANA